MAGRAPLGDQPRDFAQLRLVVTRLRHRGGDAVRAVEQRRLVVAVARRRAAARAARDVARQGFDEARVVEVVTQPLHLGRAGADRSRARAMSSRYWRHDE